MTYSPNEKPLLFLVTGSRGAGKTTFCKTLVKAAREAGWKVSGMISHPVYEDNQRTGIDAEDLSTGERRRLAVRSDQPTPGAKHWQFDDAAITWGNQVFQASLPSDLFIVDELGPLEFEQNAGWQDAFAAVDSNQYAISIVVARSEMLGQVLLRWPAGNLVEIDTPEDSVRKAQVLSDQLF